MKLRNRSANLFSPFVLSAASLLFLTACLLFPPQLYEALLPERNVMFLDVRTFLFFATCVATFCCGVLLAKPCQPSIAPPPSLSNTAIMVPLLAAVVLNAVSLTVLFRNNPWMLTEWLTDSGRVKRDYDATGGLSEALPLLFAVCWWAHGRILSRRQATGEPARLVRTSIFLAAAFAVFTAMMKAALFDLIPGLLGFLIISTTLSSSSRKSVGFLLRQGVFVLLAGAVTFSLFAFLRGQTGTLAIAESAAGYTMASYNRLSALLNGDIYFPHAGSGIYAFNFVSHVPFFHNLIDFRDAFGMPDRVEAWMTEFAAIASTGLDGRYIWVSAFGYFFADLGLWTYPYLAASGLLVGLSWKSILARRAFGLVLYPWAAFSIVLWFGSHFFVFPRLVTFLLAAMVLAAWEFVQGRRFVLQ